MDIFDKCNSFTRARELEEKGFYPYFLPISSSSGTEVVVRGKRMIMAGSNNYLGLTYHPAVQEAARQAVDRFGSSCSGSRFLNGTLEMHEELEQRLAKFLGKESALCFSTGFQTNLGVLSALCGKNDIVLCDRENHASIFDGCRLSFAEVRKFRHNDMEDLERVLRWTEENRPNSGKMIVVDGMFSMMGDLCDLPRLTALAKRFKARVLVDEAHSIGVLGRNGRGAAEHYGVEDKVDLVVGTFSKTLASLGGFVAGPEEVIHFIKHNARPLIFSAAISPANTAAALAALGVVESEPQLRIKLRQHGNRVRKELLAMGFDLGVPSCAPIVPVVLGEQDRMFTFCKALFDAGLFTNPVTRPAVPLGQDLVRTSYMASHTNAQIDRVLDIFESVGRSLGVLDPNLEGVAREM